MTRKVFWDDPYRKELETTVAGVLGGEIALAETIFFAESGGQESDHGSIAGYPVLQARWKGQEIFYTLDDGHGLEPGDPVTVAIDWPRRYRLMRLHFAAEIVLELVTRDLGRITKIGAHIAPEKARIDFEWGENISVHFPDLHQKAQAIIESDQVIVSAFSDAAAERRFWKIRDFAEVPCGGTHLKRTAEVGEIRLKRKNIGKGKERIEVALAQPRA